MNSQDAQLLAGMMIGISIGPPRPSRVFNCRLFKTDECSWGSTIFCCKLIVRALFRLKDDYFPKTSGVQGDSLAWALCSGDMVAYFSETSSRLLFGSALQGVNWNETVSSTPNQPLVFCASPSDLDEHYSTL